MSPHRLRRAIRNLAAGGLVAHPTEGVWGLACDPGQRQAVDTLLATKHRAANKGLILVAGDIEALRPWLMKPPPPAALSDWPGPITWLLPAAEAVPAWLSGGRTTIAVRVTAHRLTAALCRAWGGALVSTSANRAGRPPALNAWQLRRQLGRQPDLILTGDLDQPGKPSAIRDADGRYLRGGPQ
ncbi:MAG: L-threonylcarbamoyladenylate synthase [Salinisphaera sp.]|nr:L-threonylcarbamoyladenylate synthase [Salinisphaera sp.]